MAWWEIVFHRYTLVAFTYYFATCIFTVVILKCLFWFLIRRNLQQLRNNTVIKRWYGLNHLAFKWYCTGLYLFLSFIHCMRVVFCRGLQGLCRASCHYYLCLSGCVCALLNLVFRNNAIYVCVSGCVYFIGVWRPDAMYQCTDELWQFLPSPSPPPIFSGSL